VSLQETGGNPQQGNDINIQASGLGGGGGFRRASRNYFAWFLNCNSYHTKSLTFAGLVIDGATGRDQAKFRGPSLQGPRLGDAD